MEDKSGMYSAQFLGRARKGAEWNDTVYKMDTLLVSGFQKLFCQYLPYEEAVTFFSNRRAPWSAFEKPDEPCSMGTQLDLIIDYTVCIVYRNSSSNALVDGLSSLSQNSETEYELILTTMIWEMTYSKNNYWPCLISSFLLTRIH